MEDGARIARCLSNNISHPDSNAIEDNGQLEARFKEKYANKLEYSKDGKVKWLGSFDNLQAFVADLLDETGKWNSPGGKAKSYRSKELTITWYTDRKTLLFQGKVGANWKEYVYNLAKSYSTVMLTDQLLVPEVVLSGDESSISNKSVATQTSQNECVAKASECTECRRLSVEMAEVKLDLEILRVLMNKYHASPKSETSTQTPNQMNPKPDEIVIESTSSREIGFANPPNEERSLEAQVKELQTKLDFYIEDGISSNNIKIKPMNQSRKCESVKESGTNIIVVDEIPGEDQECQLNLVEMQITDYRNKQRRRHIENRRRRQQFTQPLSNKEYWKRQASPREQFTICKTTNQQSSPNDSRVSIDKITIVVDEIPGEEQERQPNSAEMQITDYRNKQRSRHIQNRRKRQQFTEPLPNKEHWKRQASPRDQSTIYKMTNHQGPPNDDRVSTIYTVGAKQQNFRRHRENPHFRGRPTNHPPRCERKQSPEWRKYLDFVRQVTKGSIHGQGKFLVSTATRF